MKTKIVQGVGRSKLHRDPEAPDAYEALKGLHVGGIPIEELPEELVAKLSRQHTDEDIAERNQGKVPYGTALRVTEDAFDKSIQERRDFRRDNVEVWEAPDPMKELAEKHVAPGMRPKFLSPRKIDREGTRGFEVVKNHGDPVKLGRMVLGQMPEERAKARSEFYRKKGTDRLRKIEEENAERQRELVG